jgi:L-threonylcarbamoyladenylate synthase
MQNRPATTDIQQALSTLREGGVLLYPTDTIWGLGCDPHQVPALQKIQQIKGRSEEKRYILLLENENQLVSYVREVPEVAYQMIEYAERPLTIIYSGAKNLPIELIGEEQTIAIRIVKHPFCSELLKRWRKPLVSTSANLSGQPSPSRFDEIDAQIKDQVDYVVQYGQADIGDGVPSIIMKLEPGGRFAFIRK